MIKFGKYRIYRIGKDPKTGKQYETSIPTDSQIINVTGSENIALIED